MERTDLLEKLDRVIDKVADLTVQRGQPYLTKKYVMIGNAFVEKNKKGSYNVLNSDRHILYTDISVFDVAVIIAQRHNQNEAGVIRQVLSLEDKFTKYHTDMIHYLHCMKHAKKSCDSDRMAILEDKFQMAEIHAKDVRDRISVFKRVK